MIELLRMRRSIRKYNDTPVSNTQKDILKEALLRSPTSRNKCPWRFSFIEDIEVIKKLAKSKESGSAFIEHAPLAVVIMANEEESDVWIEDCSIAACILQLCAQSIGLGSCWVQIRNRSTAKGNSSEEYVHTVLNLQEPYRIEAIIAIGHPAETRESLTTEELKYNHILRR